MVDLDKKMLISMTKLTIHELVILKGLKIKYSLMKSQPLSKAEDIYISLFQHIIIKIYNTNKCLCTLSAVVPSRLVSLFSLEPLLKMECLKI